MSVRKAPVPDDAPRRRPGRRAVLVLGAGLAAGLASRALRPPPLETVAIPGMAPFRRLAADGRTSQGLPADPLLLGLDAPAPLGPGVAAAVSDDPCGALFGDAAGAAGPIAYFSDVHCPWCRVMEDRLAEAAPAATRLIHHDWPVFGPSSRLAARAILAAETLGAGAAMRARLISARAVIDAAYLDHVAGTLGIAPAALARAMAAPGIDRRLDATRALAGLFGFPGTPALVVGRVAVSGAIAADLLARLVAQERAWTACGQGGQGT